ncbi:RNA-binding S4 domain-containing protein [Acetobacteroides hydrogenigenes]|uniref:Ribosome-associated heat shock protein Hsp15 n=1 Tax=Acetobacteroides hydrogenigenes TaxID=979970 RepID=A0A4R2F0W1_9BACT|nr:RNA-binding S4 domain-containing protein [Acetobacteroides hydrogenigenes]TCN72955.1 ribosome-associated heat shock protein Hsp15 [Acetobacteroides hydrogenigenes]
MAEVTSVRIDKWLWSIRAFKTRTDAADACKLGRVTLNGALAKASRDVKVNDIVTVKKMPVMYTFKVLALIANRQPAKNVYLYAENLTPEEELEKLKMNKTIIFVQRDRGTGRPTKKERRDIDDLMENYYWGEEGSDV